MSNAMMNTNDWIFEADDSDLLNAVEKFLSIQSTNFNDARRKKLPVPEEAIEHYHEWVGYWYQLRKGKKLSLSEVRAICGFECTVQMLECSGDTRRYLIQFNPDFTVGAHG